MCAHLQKMFSLETKIHKTLCSTLYMHIFNHSDQCKAPHQCRWLEISLVINGSSNRVVLWQYQYIHHAALCMIVSSFTITRLIDPKFAKNLVCIMIRVFSAMTVKELSLAFFPLQNANLHCTCEEVTKRRQSGCCKNCCAFNMLCVLVFSAVM